MKRYDLRHLKNDFEPRMKEILGESHKATETLIFIFEIGDFSSVQNVSDAVKENKFTLMNSLKFNEFDWTVVIKKEAFEDVESYYELLLQKYNIDGKARSKKGNLILENFSGTKKITIKFTGIFAVPASGLLLCL